ncbi:MAG TPA: hypothetical protein VKG26_03765 [Bacteroidia bacterium]|nr:hypothetical protein [Bacteroidia bacterium]
MLQVKSNTSKYFRNAILFLFMLLFLAECTSIKPNLKVSQLNYCAPPTPYVYDSTYIPLADIKPIIQNDNLLLKTFTYQDLLLANACGSLFLVQEYVHLKNDKSQDEDSVIYMMVKKQQIFNRLLLASTEVASLAAELDCESERSKQLADYLDQINDTRIQRFTILSVVSGAITGIGTSALKNYGSQVTVGITGSIVSAVFGGLAVVSSKNHIDVQHKRNLLADIWYEPKTSAVYPPFIWSVLTAKEFNSDFSTSTIKSLKSRWIEEGLIDTSASKYKISAIRKFLAKEGLADTTNKNKPELFFGIGGKYKANDLHTRTSMLNQLKAEIRSINQNLQALMLKLSV